MLKFETSCVEIPPVILGIVIPLWHHTPVHTQTLPCRLSACRHMQVSSSDQGDALPSSASALQLDSCVCSIPNGQSSAFPGQL